MDRFTNPFVFVAEFSPDKACKVEWLTELRPQTRAGAPDPTATYKYNALCSHPVTETSFDDAVKWRGLLIRCDDEEAAHTNFDDDTNVRPVPVDADLWPAAAALLQNDCECLFRAFMFREAVSVAKTRESASSYAKVGPGGGGRSSSSGGAGKRGGGGSGGGSGGGASAGASPAPATSRFEEFREVAARIFEEIPQVSGNDTRSGGAGGGGGGGTKQQLDMDHLTLPASPALAASSQPATPGSTMTPGAHLGAPAGGRPAFPNTPLSAATTTSPVAAPATPAPQVAAAPPMQIVSFTEPLLGGATVLACVFQIRDPDVRAETRSLAVALCHPDFGVVAKNGPRLVDGLVQFADMLIRDSQQLPRELASGQRYEPEPLFSRFAASWPEQQQQQQNQNQQHQHQHGAGSRPPLAGNDGSNTDVGRASSRSSEHSDGLSRYTGRTGGSGGGGAFSNPATARHAAGYLRTKRKMRILSNSMRLWHNALVRILTVVVGPPLNPMQAMMLSSARPLLLMQQDPQTTMMMMMQQQQQQQQQMMYGQNSASSYYSGSTNAPSPNFFPQNTSSSNLYGGYFAGGFPRSDSMNNFGQMQWQQQQQIQFQQQQQHQDFYNSGLPGVINHHPLFTADLVQGLRERDWGFRMTLLALRSCSDIAKSVAATAAAKKKLQLDEERDEEQHQHQQQLAASKSGSSPSPKRGAAAGRGMPPRNYSMGGSTSSLTSPNQQRSYGNLDQQHQHQQQFVPPPYLAAEIITSSQTTNILCEVLSALFKGELVLLLPNSERDARLATELAAALASLLPPHARKVAVDVPAARIKAEESRFNLISARWSTELTEGFLKYDACGETGACSVGGSTDEMDRLGGHSSHHTPDKAVLSAENIAKINQESEEKQRRQNNNKDQQKQQSPTKTTSFSYLPRVGSVVVRVSERGVTTCLTSDDFYVDTTASDIPLPRSVPCVASAMAYKIASTPPDEPLRVVLSPVLEMAQRVANAYVALLASFINGPASLIAGGGGGGGAPPKSPRNNTGSGSSKRGVDNGSFSSNPNSSKFGGGGNSSRKHHSHKIGGDSHDDTLSDGGFSLGNDSFDDRQKALLSSAFFHDGRGDDDDDDDDGSPVRVQESVGASIMTKLKSLFSSSDNKSSSNNNRTAITAANLINNTDTQSQVSLAPRLSGAAARDDDPFSGGGSASAPSFYRGGAAVPANTMTSGGDGTRDFDILKAMLMNTISIEEFVAASAAGRAPRPRLVPVEALALFQKLDSHIASHFFWHMFRSPTAADFVACMHIARRKRATGSSDE